MKRLPYREGDWFAVPLAGGGYAVGLIARSPKNGKILLGYFFGPRRFELPKVADLLALTPEEAVLVDRFGDLCLFRQEWPVLGPTPDWDRGRWVMPAFGSVEVFSGVGWRIEYPDDDPAAQPRRTRVPAEEAQRLLANRLQGAVAVAIRLNQLLP
jgi:Immunity protein 26